MNERTTATGPLPDEWNLLRAPSAMAENIEAHAPGFVRAVADLVGVLPAFVGSVYPSLASAEPRAEAMIFNQTVNDYIDLLFDVVTGRGRAAVKSARTLFELLVTLKDVVRDAGISQRYRQYDAVVAQTESRLTLELDALSGKELLAERHARLKLARDSATPAKQAIDTYGRRYASNWAGRSLADRARFHGLSEGYDFYRFASAILHGSSGGVVGHVRTLDGKPVHRTGPAISLCPRAFLYGTQFFLESIEALPKEAKSGADELRFAVRSAQSEWPAFRRAIQKLDDDLWPIAPPPHLQAVFGLGPHGTGRWYLHDAQRCVIRAALPPAELPPEYAGHIADLRRQVGAADFPPGRLLTIAFQNVRLTPAPGTTWQPDEAVLNPREFPLRRPP